MYKQGLDENSLQMLKEISVSTAGYDTFDVVLKKDPFFGFGLTLRAYYLSEGQE
eukprot:Pgem_evm1s5746